MNYLWLIKHDDLKMNLGHHQTETKFPTCRFLSEMREIQIEKGKNILANNFSLYSSSPFLLMNPFHQYFQKFQQQCGY